MADEILQQAIDERVLMLSDVTSALVTLDDGRPAYFSLTRGAHVRLKPDAVVPFLVMRLGIVTGAIAQIGTWQFCVYDHPLNGYGRIVDIAQKLKLGFNA